MEALTAYGVGTSRTLRAHWALEEVGVAYQVRDILPRSGETNTEEYRQLNPAEKIPLLVHGDFRLSESGAIVDYVLDTFGGEGRMPVPGTHERAQHDSWASFVLMEMDATALYVIRRHEGLADVYGEAPVAVESARAYFQRQARVVEATLRDGRPHLLGDVFYGVDILLGSVLGWALFVGEKLSPTLEEYRERVSARPAQVRAFETNFPPKAFAALQPS